ncbi:MAG: LysR family transcriptional regulator [Polyangiaceae bacterium]
MKRVHLGGVDLNLLVVLDDLLETRSASATARRLGRTQSAVSHALSRLRSTFDDPLFTRVGASLRPTPLAERVAAPLRAVLVDTQALVNRSRAVDPARLVRTFTLACTDFAEIVLLPSLMPRLRVEAPGVTVVTRALGAEVEQALMSRDVDLAYGTRFRPLSGIQEEAVAYEDMRVLLRRGHPATKAPLTPKSYAALDHVLVTPRGLPGGAVDRALEPLGLTRTVVLRLPHFVAAALVVAQTDLVVTLPEGVARRVTAIADLEARPLPFEMPGFTFKVAYASSLAEDAQHAWFRRLVIEAAK